MFLDQVFTRAPNVVGRQVAGEFVLVPVVRNVAEIGSIFVLNEVGSVVWSAVERACVGHDVVELVVQEFEVTPEQAKGDVESFLKDLSSAGLVGVSECKP